MIKRLMMTVAAAMMAIGAALGDNAVSEVTARGISPWKGVIEIGYTLGASETWKPLTTKVSLTDKDTGKSYTAQTFTTEPTYEAGRHTLIWDAAADGVEMVSARASVKVTIEERLPLYMVIDLSAGANALSYPVTYLDEAPAGGWTDEYKTTKLVMRRIEPGTFTMGDQVHGGWTYSNITISEPFYAGVFEVTQKQWELVMGTKPSYFNNASYYATRPVEYVSYNMIRGSWEGAGWPAHSAVDGDSFLCRIQARTGVEGLDLPTDAQWEYACRAGTTTDYNNGTDYFIPNTGSDSSMNVVGRYWYNGGSSYSSSCTTSAGTAAVGSYVPNAWGLYDMHGNVWEWCLDWYGSLANNKTDPKGPSSGSTRVLRGGSWINNGNYCVSSNRYYDSPLNYGDGSYGFRLFGSTELASVSGDSAVFAIDTTPMRLVSEVTARDLGARVIEIGYTLGTIETGKELVTKVTLTDKGTGISYIAKTFTTEPTYEAGRHTLIWNAAADGVEISYSRARVNVLIEEKNVPLYMVIDLSAGMNASSYPITYLYDAPKNGWTDDYKTTKLVLRRIEPGTFTMGDQVHGLDFYSYASTVYKNITISQPFYAGVFEVTQRQWELVMGTRPSYFNNDSYYATRPVEQVSYDMIRGSSTGAKWPESGAVDATSFMGVIRARTGIEGFDLPTEAQWEYACRAGTTNDYNNGTNYSLPNGEDSKMNVVGRYWRNGGSSYNDNSDTTSTGTAAVGSYVPNAWGLYDMHGNVWEWCLDWYNTLTDDVIDPKGAETGFNTSRSLRGGDWFNEAHRCNSSYRAYDWPSQDRLYEGNYGFRLFCSAESSDRTFFINGYSEEFMIDTLQLSTYSTLVPVPYAWLDKYRLAETVDYESAASALSGKKDAFGRDLPVYADYVAGTDPTNENSRLAVAIKMKADGTPEITWTPNLGAERKYTVYGTKTLDEDCEWEEVEKGQEAEYRFFSVGVEMIGR